MNQGCARNPVGSWSLRALGQCASLQDFGRLTSIQALGLLRLQVAMPRWRYFWMCRSHRLVVVRQRLDVSICSCNWPAYLWAQPQDWYLANPTTPASQVTCWNCSTSCFHLLLILSHTINPCQSLTVLRFWLLHFAGTSPAACSCLASLSFWSCWILPQPFPWSLVILSKRGLELQPLEVCVQLAPMVSGSSWISPQA